MKTLLEAWTRNGFTHQVIRREGMVALVRRQHKDVSDPHWEVVKIRVSPAKFVHGVPLPECEVYPSAEEWGKRGWTYKSLETAKAKFEELTKAKDQP